LRRGFAAPILFHGISPMTSLDRLKSDLLLIDEQHERISSIIDSLLKATREGSPIEDLQGQMKELVNILHTHFTQENSLFAQHGYPDITSHMQEHKRIFEEINSQYQLIKRGEKTLSPLLADHLRYIEDCHIDGADQAYIDYFGNKLKS